MTRNFKVLGLVLAAFFAVSAVSAQAAFAEEFFHSHAKHIVITGEQHPQFPNQVLVINNESGERKAEFACKKLKLSGDSESNLEGSPGTWTTTEATVHPEYSECEIIFPIKETVTVSTGKCHYRFTAKTEETTLGEKHARVKVTCPKGENITISSPSGCKITISNPETAPGEFGQTPTHGVVYTNVNTTSETNKKEITAHATVKGIEYTTNLPCHPAGIPASGKKAEYNGTSTVFAHEYIEGTTEAGYKEGSQVGIWKE